MASGTKEVCEEGDTRACVGGRGLLVNSMLWGQNVFKKMAVSKILAFVGTIFRSEIILSDLKMLKMFSVMSRFRFRG